MQSEEENIGSFRNVEPEVFALEIVSVSYTLLVKGSSGFKATWMFMQ